MELFLRSKYKENLQDLDGGLCKQRLEAMFHYQETGEILENIDLGVKSILRQQIKERTGDKKNYDDACEKQRLKALKRWHPEEYNRMLQNATVCRGIPQDANSNSNSNNNIKEEIIKEENDVREDGKKRYLKNVRLKETEYNKLVEQYGKKIIEEYILRLNDYMVRKGRTYTDHYLTILKRLSKDNVKKKSEKEDKPIDSLKPTLSKPKLPGITKLKKDC